MRNERAQARILAMLPRTGDGAGGDGAKMGGIPHFGLTPTGALFWDEEAPRRKVVLDVLRSCKEKGFWIKKRLVGSIRVSTYLAIE
jgi:hypothetical protein